MNRMQMFGNQKQTPSWMQLTALLNLECDIILTAYFTFH